MRRWLRYCIPLAVSLTIIVAIALSLKLSAALGQDLQMILNPHSLALDLEHGQEAEAQFTLTTNNYLFCEAVCNYKITDIAESALIEEGRDIIMLDAKLEINKVLRAPERGTGTKLYQLEVTCRNRETRLCSRSPEPHGATSLVSLSYKPSVEEMAIKEHVRPLALAFLATAASFDAEAQRVAAKYKVLGEDLDGTEQRVERVLQARQLMFNEAHQVRNLWLAEHYEEIRQLLPSTAGQLLEEARNVSASLDLYAEAQHTLANRLGVAMAELPDLGVAYTLGRANGTEAADRLLAYGTRLVALEEDTSASPTQNVLTRNQELDGLEAEKESALEAITAISEALVRRLETQLNRTPGEPTTAYLFELCEALNSSDCAFFNVSIRKPWTASARGVLKVEFEEREYASTLPISLREPGLQCCFAGTCRPCIAHSPVLFLHGHSVLERNAPEYSLEAFAKYLNRLQEQRLFVNAGAFTPYDAVVGSEKPWIGFPIAVHGTYYYDSYLNGSSYILSIAKSESIDTYAIRVKELVDALKFRTGSESVIIVANSMGGLVARRYLQLFGDQDTTGLIMLGTPNHGVEHRVAFFCPFLGADKECEEMKTGSSMLAKLNDPARQPSIPLTVVYGTGCDTGGSDGDGIVVAESAMLPNAQNIKINGTCPSTADPLHTAMLDTERYPAAYDAIREKILELR